MIESSFEAIDKLNGVDRETFLMISAPYLLNLNITISLNQLASLLDLAFKKCNTDCIRVTPDHAYDYSKPVGDLHKIQIKSLLRDNGS